MKIFFRALEPADAEMINNWRKNELMEEKVAGAKRFVSLEREKKWVESLIMNDDQSKFYFAVCEKESAKMVGYTSISEVDYRNGGCFWSGIKIDPAFSGKGYGYETALLVLKYVFEELRMERCWGSCLEEHEIVMKMLLKVGFKKEGLMRNSIFKFGEYKSVWLLSVVREEYSLIKNLIV